MTFTTLQYHNVLNPSLWNDNKLKEDVRTAMLKFGYVFAKNCGIDNDQINDIIFTGGNANYNYTNLSDIDIHVIVDIEKIAGSTNTDILKLYYRALKSLWVSKHHIKINNYELEPYIQDSKEPMPHNQGIYSLLHDKWISQPVFLNLDFSKIDGSKKLEKYKNNIDFIINSKQSSDKVKLLKDKLKFLRSVSIAKHGEFSEGNLIFKELRNLGYIDKLNNYNKQITDAGLSYNNVNKQ